MQDIQPRVESYSVILAFFCVIFFFCVISIVISRPIPGRKPTNSPKQVSLMASDHSGVST